MCALSVCLGLSTNRQTLHMHDGILTTGSSRSFGITNATARLAQAAVKNGERGRARGSRKLRVHAVADKESHGADRKTEIGGDLPQQKRKSRDTAIVKGGSKEDWNKEESPLIDVF